MAKRDDGSFDALALLTTVAGIDETGCLDVEKSFSHDDSNPDRALDILSKLEAEGALSRNLDVRFKVKENIGKGGMGLVRLAEQRSVGRHVALKSVRPDRDGKEPTASILREAWAMGTLEHPNVVPIYDLGVDDSGQPIVVMRRISGVEWAELISDAEAIQRRFGDIDVVEWNISVLMQVINAVRYAHSRGIVHRDLKPSNVMIGEFGEVYVLDWGLAAVTDERLGGRLPSSSASSGPIGTPGYMAPEMLRASKVDPRTDIYLLGGMLYQATTGQIPHYGADMEEVVASIESSPPELAEHVPAALAEICQTAMAYDADDRYQRVEDLHTALRHYLKHRNALALAQRADERLEYLETQVATLRGQDRLGNAADEGVYTVFSECRFALRESLQAWPENGEAREVLRRAYRLMIELQLERELPEAAKNLLAESDVTDSELRSRVETAAAAEAARRRRLDRLSQIHNRGRGWRTRSFILSVLCVLWSALPISLEFAHPQIVAERGRLATISALILAALTGIAYWARETMFATAFNRQIVWTILFIPMAQLVLIAGAEILDLPPRAFALAFFLWFVIAGMFTIATSVKIIGAPLAFLVAFLYTAWNPEHVFWVMAVSNATWISIIWVYSLGLRDAEQASQSWFRR